MSKVSRLKAALLGGLVLPLLGARRRIRRAKTEKLTDLRQSLREAEEDLAAGRGAPQPGRVADLVALEQRIDSVREWPFDSSTVLRFALYLLIPLGSWAGGALVERAIDSLLD